MTSTLRGAAGTVVGLVLLAGCAGGGIGSVGEDQSFSTCVERSGSSLRGASDWDTAEQASFLAEREMLACAVRHLSDDELAEALDPAFADPGDDGDTSRAIADDQVRAISQLGADTVRAEGEDAAVAASARVVDAADASEERSDLLAEMAAFGIMVGDLGFEGYDEYRRHNADSNLDDVELDTRFVQDVRSGSEEAASVGKRLASLTEAIAETTPAG